MGFLIAKAGRVIVVDFSFPFEDMQKMAAGREFIWIDHHKSALTEIERGITRLAGLARYHKSSLCAHLELLLS